MVDFVLVSYLVAVAVSLAVGLPTTLRSLRRRDTPLVLLGLAVSIDGLEWLAWTLASYTPAYETPLGDALSIASRIGISVSAVFIMSFTRLAFRPGSRIAMVFVSFLSGSLILSFACSGVVGDWTGVRNDHVWVWLEQAALLTCYLWTSLEAGYQHILAKRRAAFGLSEAMVANRLLLWSVYAGLFFLAEVVYAITLGLFGMLSVLDILNASLTIAAEIALCFAVFPPRWYRRWVSGSAGTETV